jgi:hypothetical protein
LKSALRDVEIETIFAKTLYLDAVLGAGKDALGRTGAGLLEGVFKSPVGTGILKALGLSDVLDEFKALQFVKLTKELGELQKQGIVSAEEIKNLAGTLQISLTDEGPFSDVILRQMERFYANVMGTITERRHEAEERAREAKEDAARAKKAADDAAAARARAANAPPVYGYDWRKGASDLDLILGMGPSREDLPLGIRAGGRSVSRSGGTAAMRHAGYVSEGDAGGGSGAAPYELAGALSGPEGLIGRSTPGWAARAGPIWTRSGRPRSPSSGRRRASGSPSGTWQNTRRAWDRRRRSIPSWPRRGSGPLTMGPLLSAWPLSATFRGRRRPEPRRSSSGALQGSGWALRWLSRPRRTRG